MSEYSPRRSWSACRIALLLAIGVVACSTTPTIGESPIKLSDSTLDKAQAKYGPEAKKRLQNWQALLNGDKKGDDNSKLAKVNDFFNETITFAPDQQVWGVEDYWATPVEFLVRGAGDCEDFAIAKYFSLLALGVPENKLRITYVQASGHGPTNLAHMVLTYYATPSAMPVVLDNLIPEIKPASQRTDLTPVYGFNGQGLWLAKDRSTGNAAPRKNNIGFWDKLMARQGKELD
ncbi:transglutaminase-like cysteine peptidase [Chitinibacter bivalviorum]|uniref:Transglutaminase-like cysteine peptidase n=1 Tax=Chitinibacter bivalviorum TaxID=2739434 RepID=A0A7H9BLU3_9NEIS|nr:transglutaminase-like cysteine peptidase [Chitinibacter bivalviorum]QLG89640.1 transglutaminase-like cysteine peptidase [Chitinibacter bivalviorum]